MPKASTNPTQRPRRRERVATQIEQDAPGGGRAAIERALAVAVVVLGALAVLGFAATLAHVGLRGTVPFFASELWQWAYWLPLLALPLMILSVIALVTLTAAGRRRSR